MKSNPFRETLKMISYIYQGCQYKTLQPKGPAMLQASWLQFCNIIPYDCRLTQVPHFPVGMGHHGLDLTSANGCFDSLCFYTWLFYQRLLCRIIRQVPLVYLFTCPNPSNGSTFWNVNVHWSGFFSDATARTLHAGLRCSASCPRHLCYHRIHC